MHLTEPQVFWYEQGILSAEHEEKLAQLRQQLEQEDALVPELCDRLALLRFLKARHWNVHKAETMYKAMAAWRGEHQVQQLLGGYDFSELPQVRKYYPHFYHKIDRWGRPVYIELLGQTDIDALMKVTTIDRFLKYHIQQCEAFRSHKLPACSAAAGRTILTQTIILDMAGLSPTRHFTLTVKRFLEALSQVDQDCFPEHLGCMFMINTPWVFRSFWSVIKGFLDERTLAKIKVLGSNYQDELLAVIPAENLPVMFGGSSPCTELVDVGPWQNPAIINADPVLFKAAAGGQLALTSCLPNSDSCSSLTRSPSSLIGTSVQLTAAGSSST